MSRRANSYAASFLLGASALLAPSPGLAASGGAGIVSSPGNTNASAPSGTIGLVPPGASTVSATGNGITIASPTSGLLRNELRFTGSVPATSAGGVVEIERLGRQTHGAWAPTAHATAAADGSFTVLWRANHIGPFQIRAVVQQPGTASIAAASPTVTMIVYRPSIATQYGPGFYGSKTACGEVLRQHTLGVANRTLPCGTLVAIYYQGRRLVVPVIDRGPYANGADWDLTEATGHALGIDGTATIGAVSLPSSPPGA